MIYCTKCKRELEDSIPQADYDEDETDDNVGISISMEVKDGARVLTVGGILCAACMRRGAKIPIPPKIEVVSSPLDELRKREGLHMAKTMRAVIDLEEQEEAEEADKIITTILGETTRRDIDDVVITSGDL